MSERTYNDWGLFKIEGWTEANNTLDTLLYQELTDAEQRRNNGNENLIESAWTIRDNMLDRMNGFLKFGARESDPELLLIIHVCDALDLPVGCMTKFYQDRTAS